MATSVQKAIADLRKVQSCQLPQPIKVDPESCYDFKAKTSVQQALCEKGKGPAFINPQILKPNYRVYEDYVNAPTTRITGTTSGTIPVTIAPASSCYGHFPNVSHWSGPDTRSRHYVAGGGDTQEKRVGSVKKIRSKKKLIAERKRAEEESSNILPAGTKRRRNGKRALNYETPKKPSNTETKPKYSVSKKSLNTKQLGVLGKLRERGVEEGYARAQAFDSPT